MNKRYILRADTQKAFISSQIEHLPADGSMEIIIRPHKTTRTIEQNNLYWLWVGFMADEIGYKKNQLHDALRGSLLAPVVYPDLNTGVVKERLRSTTELSVGEFTEYLNAIEEWAADFMGMTLPRPEDQYAIAMGYERVKKTKV